MRRDAGFTLLEVLVALTIMAVGVALALSLVSGSLGNIRKVRVHARTVEHTQAVMELELLDDSITGPTTQRGDFDDGTRWSLVVSEVEMPVPQTTMQIQMPVKVLSYVVEVTEPNSVTADYTLQTLKLVNAAQQPGQRRGGQ